MHYSLPLLMQDEGHTKQKDAAPHRGLRSCPMFVSLDCFQLMKCSNVAQKNKDLCPF